MVLPGPARRTSTASSAVRTEPRTDVVALDVLLRLAVGWGILRACASCAGLAALGILMTGVLRSFTLVALVALAMVRAGAQAPAGPSPAVDNGQRFQQALTLMEAQRDYLSAAKLFEQVAAGADRSLASRALVYAGVCYERLGRAE